jgi:hypothetical protein
MIRFYTSANNKYLPKARVLAKSIKKFHPDGEITLLLSDKPVKGFNLEKEYFDRILTVEDIDIKNLEPWMFQFNVVELCTAVKGWGLSKLLSLDNTEGVIYLDPDIMVMNRLDEIFSNIDHFDIQLTPHLLEPENDQNLIEGNEIKATLAHGIFNLGFLAVKNGPEGKKFARWWDERLRNYCFDDVPRGLFTDQKWCDLVPAFFENINIIRDPGCNVATWNLPNRKITVKDNKYYANNSAIKFYHFTGFDAGYNFENAVKKSYPKGSPIMRLWSDYLNELNQAGNYSPSLDYWNYGYYENGEKIEDWHRKEYRKQAHKDKNPYLHFYDSLDGRTQKTTTREVEDLRHELRMIYASRSWKLARFFSKLYSALKTRVFNPTG